MAKLVSKVWSSSSEEETIKIGAEIGELLRPGDLVSLFGDLGAGKTTIIKGIASSFAQVSPREVNSPTFVYLNIYEGEKVLYHFDLYRLKGEAQFLEMGFDEYLFADGAVCLEWSERIYSLLPPQRMELYLHHLEEGKRRIELRSLS